MAYTIIISTLATNHVLNKYHIPLVAKIQGIQWNGTSLEVVTQCWGATNRGPKYDFTFRYKDPTLDALADTVVNTLVNFAPAGSEVLANGNAVLDVHLGADFGIFAGHDGSVTCPPNDVN